MGYASKSFYKIEDKTFRYISKSLFNISKLVNTFYDAGETYFLEQKVTNQKYKLGLWWQVAGSGPWVREPTIAV